MIAQKAVGQRLVFTQQAQQQVLRFNVRRAELAGLISGEEDYAPCFLCIPLKHMPSPRCSQSPLPETSLSLPGLRTRDLSGKKPFYPAGASVTEAQQCRAGQTYCLPTNCRLKT